MGLTRWLTNSCKLINCDGRWSIVLYWVFISGHWQDMFPLTVEGEFRTLQASERQRHLSNLHQWSILCPNGTWQNWSVYLWAKTCVCVGVCVFPHVRAAGRLLSRSSWKQLTNGRLRLAVCSALSYHTIKKCSFVEEQIRSTEAAEQQVCALLSY